MLESQVAKRIENYEPASRQQKVALFLHSAHTRVAINRLNIRAHFALVIGFSIFISIVTTVFVASK